LSFVLDGEVDECGRASKRCGDRAGSKSSALVVPPKACPDACAHRYHRNHQVIRCVDYAPRIFDWEPRTYGRDFVANDADVRDACVGRGHYRAVSNHRVQNAFAGLDLSRGFRNRVTVARKDFAAVDFQCFFFIAAHQVDIEIALRRPSATPRVSCGALDGADQAEAVNDFVTHKIGVIAAYLAVMQ